MQCAVLYDPEISISLHVFANKLRLVMYYIRAVIRATRHSPYHIAVYVQHIDTLTAARRYQRKCVKYDGRNWRKFL